MEIGENINQIKKPEQPVEFIYDGYSADQEFDMIKGVYKKIDEYRKNNYKPKLPDHPKFREIEGLSDKKDVNWEELKEIFKNEFYNSDYTSEIEKVKKQEFFLAKVVGRLKSLKEKYNLEIFPQYKILFVTYGMGGMYDSEDNAGIVVLGKKDDPSHDYGITCIHEMVHIGIDNSIVKKYNLSQKVKERIVDQICRLEFADMAPSYKMQGDTANIIIDEYILNAEGKIVDDINTAIAKFKEEHPEDNDKSKLNAKR